MAETAEEPDNGFLNKFASKKTFFKKRPSSHLVFISPKRNLAAEITDKEHTPLLHKHKTNDYYINVSLVVTLGKSKSHRYLN